MAYREYQRNGQAGAKERRRQEERDYGRDAARGARGPHTDREGRVKEGRTKEGWKKDKRERTEGRAGPEAGPEGDGGFARRRRAPAEARTESALRYGAPVREDALPYLLMGRKAVKEALKSGRSIERILVQKDPDGSLRELLAMARERNVDYREVDRSKLDAMCMPFGHGEKTGNHQGVVAQVPGVEYCDISDILDEAKARGEAPFVLLLDGIEDPHNLGSILRSAECAGAHGVIIPKRRAAGVTAAAAKASAGAVEYMKVAQVSNLSGAIARLKEEGLWIAGADMAGTPMYGAPLGGPLGLVIGGEGRGLSELVKRNCDFLVSIPLRGRIESLNASVAAAVLLYEKLRADGLREGR